jgi:cytidyltransferase-like protein
MPGAIQSKILKEEDLKIIREKYADKKIVFCTGCFDLLQPGHAVFFAQCRTAGDILVVGVGRDETIEELKGPGRPVNPEINRLYLVAAMQDVDFATLNDHHLGAHKIDFKNVLERLHPNIFILNDDDSSISPKQKLCDELGIILQLVKREVPDMLIPTSTTRIINKINFSYQAPLRIDFAGGWTDVPYIMKGKTGYVSNIAINPLIELRGKNLNFSGYPRGSGLSTSTAVKLLEMLNSKTYNAEPKSLQEISEDLFNLENKELKWFIGRQDQYSIVHGGFNCFEFHTDEAHPMPLNLTNDIISRLRSKLILLHTSESRNAQIAVEEVYQNYNTPNGQEAIETLAACGLEFGKSLSEGNLDGCAAIISRNWEAQKLLAPSSSNTLLDSMYQFAMENGATGGKLCGAGGGGAFLFYSEDPDRLKKVMKHKFPNCFEIDFNFEMQNIKELNSL